VLNSSLTRRPDHAQAKPAEKSGSKRVRKKRARRVSDTV
jgi:hypothetical protein